ncbi:MAG: regulatory protein AfsR [Chloroflexota bacterium]|nr:hypothetical protein [Chloroflexota bacterium]GIK56332.1 MAG: regulatory protein AfsR [Chloroflexota bacterium]
MARLEISLLGSPKIQLDGKVITGLPAKAQALLFYLVVSGQQQTRERLAEMLFSEETMMREKKLSNLRGPGALLALNEVLSAFVETRKFSVAFNTESDYWLDLDEFHACLRNPNPTPAQLQRAVDLYQGDFLTGLRVRDADGFEEWAEQVRRALETQIVTALYLLAVHYKEQRQFVAALTCITRLLAINPYFEEANRELMLLLALTSQINEACSHYERYESLLAEDGLEPEPETTVLYQKIWRGEIAGNDVGVLPMPTPPPQAWSPPFQAPPLLPHFVGRDDLRARIMAALQAEDGDSIAALVGMGGVGKSVLAAEIAHALQEHFSDGVLWASVAVSEPTAVLESWAQAYGYDFSRLPDLENMANAFRGVLAGKRVLLVLDDVVSVSRVRPLLPNSPHCRVLLTTRDQDLAHALDAQVWRLAELSPANGLLLLTRILGHERVVAEMEAAGAICDLLQNLPLAVEIIGQRLKSRPRRQLADVIPRLRDEKQRLSELKISDRAVRASFAISYDTLDAQERQMFALMGLFHGRSFAADLMAGIAGQDRYETEDRIFALVALSLAQEEGATRYRQHPLLADFAREKLVESGEAGEWYGRLVQTCLAFAQKHQHEYDTLRPEWETLMAAMQTAHDYELWQMVIEFADALHDAWFARGRYTQARQGYRWAFHAAQQTENTPAQARCLHNWGVACLEQRDFEEASDHLSQSSNLCAAGQDLAGLAQNQCDLARIAVEQSNYDLAKQWLHASRALYQSLGDLPGVAETLHVEARMNYFRGKHEETIRLGKEALAILANTAVADKALRTLSLLASAFIMQKDFISAKSYAQHALELSEKVQDKGDQAVVLGVLSYIAHQLNDLDTAQTYGEKSLELLQNMGDLGSQAMILYQLGRIYLLKEQYELALQVGLKSLELCRKSQFNLQLGWTLTHIAACFERLGQMSQAREKWQEAWKVAQSLQHPALMQKVQEGLNRP